MSQIQPVGDAPAASLVGSLEVFTLADVLTLLAESRQDGELQVIGAGSEGRVWLEEGELSNAHVGTAATIGQAVFELACISDGWFYFTSGLTSSSGQPRVPVRAVLAEVQAQVDEWRELRELIPFGSVVSLAPEPPSDDVQLRGDQWRMVATIGNRGRTVTAVLDAIGDDQMSGLRTLRDLFQAGLIMLEDSHNDNEPTRSSTPGIPDTSGNPGSPAVRTGSPFVPPVGVPPVGVPLARSFVDHSPDSVNVRAEETTPAYEFGSNGFADMGDGLATSVPVETSSDSGYTATGWTRDI
ncbi:MAG: DUF4388 domain-containing protein [Acidimicrobiales bacterium]